MTVPPPRRRTRKDRLKAGISLVTAAALCSVGACGASSPPNPVDVQAAKACQAFYDYLDRKATGPQVLNAVVPLLPKSGGSGEPTPKWAGLGHDLLQATSAAFNRESAKLKTIGDKAVRECASIPAPAKAVVGFKG